MFKYANELLKINKLYNKKFLSISFVIIYTLLAITSLVIIVQGKSFINNDSMVLFMFYTITILIIITILIRYFTRIYDNVISQNISGSAFLHKRIILAFCLVSAVPTIIVALFSTYIFNTALQPWFDKKITNILKESTSVAQAYLDDQIAQLRENGLSIASDFGEMSYMLLNNPRLLGELLNGQAELRSLDEAIIFENNTNTILAQTPLAFSLAFTTIPKYIIEMADQGKAVQVPSDPTKIRFLVKLPDYPNTYLLIGRLINKQIIQHVDKNKGAAKAYFILKQDITHLQIKFSILFLIIACLLLGMAITWGIIIARQIVQPIQNLVLATEQAQNGDLTVQVSEENLVNDEVRILTSAFNLMIKRLHRQHKDLVIAQRAMAWSDVARRIAHEIKNPLTPIQLASERLMKKFHHEVADQEAFARYVRTILTHSKDIEKIVAEFVSFARMPLPNFTKFDLLELVNETVGNRKLLNEQIEYEIITTEKIISFIGDPLQISRVILNLLKNAEEALEKNSVPPKITVCLQVLAEELHLTVKDNGHGFKDYLLDKASEAYVTSRSKGMGLGLAIVRKIVEDHFGVLEIANNCSMNNISNPVELEYKKQGINATEDSCSKEDRNGKSIDYVKQKTNSIEKGLVMSDDVDKIKENPSGGACVKIIFNLNELKNKLP